jgi:DNA-binding HxlR family transcriptional regulator
MSSGRTYHESCPLAHSLDLIGERWALLVVREVMFGPRRFTDIQARLDTASSSVLTERLHRLVEAGIATRRRLPPPAASWVYELTEWGHGLRPAMIALARWGRQSPARDLDQATTPAAIAMAMLVHFEPSRARGLDLEVDLDLDGDQFRAVVRDASLHIGPPREKPAQARVRVARPHLKALVGGSKSSPRTLATVGVDIDGDSRAVVALLGTLTS